MSKLSRNGYRCEGEVLIANYAPLMRVVGELVNSRAKAFTIDREPGQRGRTIHGELHELREALKATETNGHQHERGLKPCS